MFYRFLCLLLSVLCSYGSAQTAVAQLAVFNVSPSAQPGEAVSLQGNFGEQAKVYLIRGADNTPTPLPATIQSAGQATVQIPQDADLDLYQIWVEEQGQRSPSVYVNRPQGMHFDSPEVTPEGFLRIFGRNLQVKGGVPRVRFVDQNGTSAGEGVINPSKSDAYALSLKTPSTLRPGTTYEVYISNGLGGSAGEIKAERTVTAIDLGTDYFKLGVGWAAKLNFYTNVYNVKTDTRLSLKAVGDGNANDQPAIQAAIDKAHADGGGIVFLPAGTYKLTYNLFAYIQMRHRVVLQGAGKDRTVLKFGYDLGEHHMGVYWPSEASQAGLADLSLLNVDATGSALVGNMRGGQAQDVFMQRIRFDLNRGDWLWLTDCHRLVIANSDFTQGIDSQTNYHGPLQLNGSHHFVIANNTVTYAVDGLNLNFAQDGVFEHNRVYRDGSARYPTHLVNHVLVVNFAHNLAVLNNLFEVINGPPQNSNDGESIIAEGGGPDRIDEETGTVSGATASSLQDHTKQWSGYRLKPVVAIVHGKGMGQWRFITSRTANTLTVDRPWSVVPGAGSRYAIFNWGSYNWLVQGNRFEGNRRGITLYHNATNQVAIVGNALINSGSIDLTPIQHSLNTSQKFIPMYNNQIIGNTVSNTNGENGVFIGVHTVQTIQEKVFGTSVIGLEVRHNTVTAGRPNVPAIVDAPFPEGYLNYVQFHPLNTYFVGDQIPAILGSIFQNNTAINCDHAVYLNSGSYNTYVCNMELVNSANLLKDDRLERVAHASVRTAFCATNPVEPSSAILNVYPNPVAAELRVQLATAGARLLVYSLTGALLIDARTATAEARLDVQHLSAGAYLLVAQPDRGKQASHYFVRQQP